MDNKKVPKKTPNFYCKNCDYVTSRKSQWERHLQTVKHLSTIKRNFLVPKQNDTIDGKHICSCGREYKFRSGLCKHQKSCKFLYQVNNSSNSEHHGSHLEEMVTSQDVTDAVSKTTQDVLKVIMEENNELRKMLSEQQRQIGEIIPKIGNTTNNTTNRFNLNVFLNTECKDAINIMDFVKSLQLQLQDLEAGGRLGYVDNMTKIILRGLEDLELHKRPIHCSDLKREVLYVKDNDEWAKENEDNELMKKAIKYIRRSNLKQIPAWVDENPECLDSSRLKNKEYMNIIQNTMGAPQEEEETRNMSRIIRNVAKEVTLDKNELMKRD